VLQLMHLKIQHTVYPLLVYAVHSMNSKHVWGLGTMKQDSLWSSPDYSI